MNQGVDSTTSSLPGLEMDLRGKSAAWCILRACRALKDLPPGALLVLWATDPSLGRMLPRVLDGHGHRIERAGRRGRELFWHVRRAAEGGAANDQIRRNTMSQLLTEVPEFNGSVDARGSACPGPLLEAKKAIATVKVGEILEVLSNDPGTKDDIPIWAQKVGHEYLGHAEADGYERVFVRRRK